MQNYSMFLDTISEYQTLSKLGRTETQAGRRSAVTSQQPTDFILANGARNVFIHFNFV